jgi:mannose/fructose/N-acetylgalactosamine-specific phosphotransferase system component IID
MVSLRHPIRDAQEALNPSHDTARAVSRGVSILGIVVFGVAVATTIALLPDIARYIRIKTM